LILDPAIRVGHARPAVSTVWRKKPIAKPSSSAEAVNIGSGHSDTNAPDTGARGEKVSAPIQTGITATLEPPPEVLLTKRDDGARQQNNQPLSATSPVNAPAASVVSPKPNSAQSIRYALAIHSEPAVKPDVKANNRKADDANTQPARLIKRDAKPNFGAMLPVRLMGVLYTLRIGSLARLELVRDLKTQHWQLKRGTVFIGNVVSGDLDRACLQIKGFIDPDSQAFVKIEGEVLGNDGGAGLRGRQKRISPAWVKVLDRAAQAGVQIATGILNRRSSSVIVATDPYGTYRSTAGPTESSDQNRSFVEVQAGTMGFVLVTMLPDSSRSDSHLAGSGAGEGSLTEEELAELMTTADPARIRAALPKMNPELQQVARALLNEIESGKP